LVVPRDKAKTEPEDVRRREIRLKNAAIIPHVDVIRLQRPTEQQPLFFRRYVNLNLHRRTSYAIHAHKPAAATTESAVM
jgi:hypothetical protein